MAMINTGSVPGWVVLPVYLVGCWQLGVWAVKAIKRLWALGGKEDGDV